MKVVAAFGGGVDSTAMLIGMVERDEPVDLILFADTGGEKPHTYRHIERFSEWLVLHDMPEVTMVREDITLEQDCLTRKALPSIAYGFKTCSQRFKLRPQERFLKQWTDGPVTMLIGYDATEARRVRPSGKDQYTNRYPLIEWGWDRKKCVEVIHSVGLPSPGKSACFFCPSSKAWEILDLKTKYRHLLERALVMEGQAVLTDIKGLGRDFSWADMLKFDEKQVKLFDDDWSTAEVPCGCYDG